jgi:hypothetical protein
MAVVRGFVSYMSEVISFRLNKSNVWESDATEVLEVYESVE